MELSIVATMYGSAPFVKEFYSRITAVADDIVGDYEIIFVNDGSPDNSLEIAIDLHKHDNRVKVIDLSRNFGHHKAIMTGLAHAKGELVFLIDCDLEEKPEWLGKFYARFSDSTADVVYGVQTFRKGRFFERISGEIFWKLFNVLSGQPVAPNQSVARLMSSRYVTRLLEHRDCEPFLAGLMAITGFKQAPLPVNKIFKGDSTYDMKRKINILVHAITSFSNKPLVLVFYLGLVISSLSIIAACYLIVRNLFFDALLAGWPSLIVSIWFLSGAIIFCIGIIGVYLSRIFIETKQRPYTIIRQIYERNDDL